MQQPYPSYYASSVCNGEVASEPGLQQQTLQPGVASAFSPQVQAQQPQAGAFASHTPSYADQQAAVSWSQQQMLQPQQTSAPPQQYFSHSTPHAGVAPPAAYGSSFGADPVSSLPSDPCAPQAGYAPPPGVTPVSAGFAQPPSSTVPSYPVDGNIMPEGTAPPRAQSVAAPPSLTPVQQPAAQAGQSLYHASTADQTHPSAAPAFLQQQGGGQEGRQPRVGDRGLQGGAREACLSSFPGFNGEVQQPHGGGAPQPALAPAAPDTPAPATQSSHVPSRADGLRAAFGDTQPAPPTSAAAQATAPSAVPGALQAGLRHTAGAPPAPVGGQGGAGGACYGQSAAGHLPAELAREREVMLPLESMAVHQVAESSEDLGVARWSAQTSLLAAQGQAQTGAASVAQRGSASSAQGDVRGSSLGENASQRTADALPPSRDGDSFPQAFGGSFGSACPPQQSATAGAGPAMYAPPLAPSLERQKPPGMHTAPPEPVPAPGSTSRNRRPSPETAGAAASADSRQSRACGSVSSSRGPHQGGGGAVGSTGAAEAAAPPVPRISTLTRAVNSRIDPSQVPRPDGRSESVTQEGGRVYESDKYNLPPSPCSIYTVLDRGSCSCRYVRCTLNHVPAFSHTLSLSSLLFATLVQPFAQKGRFEEDIPIVDLTETSLLFTCHLSGTNKHRYGALPPGGAAEGRKGDGKHASDGPVRCPRCRCYINPFMAWASGGNECVCNLCDHHFLLPDYYMEALHLYRSQMNAGSGGRPMWREGDRNGEARGRARASGTERQELWKGSVDFVAPPAFEAKLEPRKSAGSATLPEAHAAASRAKQASRAEGAAACGAVPSAALAGAHGPQSVPAALSAAARRAQEEEAEGRLLSRFPCVVFVLDISRAALNSNLANSSLHALAELLRTTRGTLRVQIALILYSDRLVFFPRRRRVSQKQAAGLDGEAYEGAENAGFGEESGGEATRYGGDGSASSDAAGATSDQADAKPRKVEAAFVNDIEDPFMPAPVDLLFYSPHHYQELLSLLEELPKFLAELSGDCGERSAGNAALRAAANLVCDRGAGGMVEMFYASPPNHGIGALNPDITGKTTTGVGGATFEFQQREFYEALLLDCSAGGVCVDVHAYPSTRKQKMLLQTLGSIATHTGGKVFYQHDFVWTRDYHRIYEDIHRLLTSPLAFMCEAKLRTSSGIAIDKVLAPFGGPRVFYDQTAFRIPRMDADLTVAFLCKHVQQLDSVKQVYIQFVCAYTPLQPMETGRFLEGSNEFVPPPRRYLRVHTLSVPVTFSLSSLFRFAEVESMVAVMVRLAAKMVLHSENGWRENATERVVSILHAYRANCASTSSAGQLILPDSLKLLPIYIMALFKHAAFRSSEVREDERIWHLVRFMGLPVQAYPTLLYPRVFPLHRSYIEKAREKKMLQRAGQPTGVGENVYLPDSLPATGVKISSDGVFLCDVGTALFLYIGSHVKAEYIAGLFGEGVVVNEQNAPLLQLRTDEGSAGSTVSRIVEQIRREKAALPYLPLRVVCANSLDETRLLTHLVEDAIAGDGCYVDFLCGLHKMVHNKLDDG
ncbi:Sec23/Sec24 trunk domain-containing protein [Besnoitia besnoiti]|uniref:Sec23/Sec24 trunk domain-containing protein n=1 Tax=Besnoitia besnoiti TaxID=94643 RepID=A0A2A9MHI8_BESBE|nr:Sec23/Sec24 trunk domain-containing protein [Besnoitia besnoiti]PFH35123.1 Sec23/Sec24 trunk domain-containing protein [Besnoitia besnoiti]